VKLEALASCADAADERRRKIARQKQVALLRGLRKHPPTRPLRRGSPIANLSAILPSVRKPCPLPFASALMTPFKRDTWRNMPNEIKRIQVSELSSSNGTAWEVTEPTRRRAIA